MAFFFFFFFKINPMMRKGQMAKLYEAHLDPTLINHPFALTTPVNIKSYVSLTKSIKQQGKTVPKNNKHVSKQYVLLVKNEPATMCIKKNQEPLSCAHTSPLPGSNDAAEEQPMARAAKCYGPSGVITHNHRDGLAAMALVQRLIVNAVCNNILATTQIITTTKPVAAARLKMCDGRAQDFLESHGYHDYPSGGMHM